MSSEYKAVTIAILNFNGRELLNNTIRSAQSMEYPNKKLLVVDDGSTDGSVSYLHQTFPEIPVIEMGMNTKMLNRVRNTALEAAETDYVFITDNDITFEPDCLTRLMNAAQSLEDASVLIPRVMYRHEKNRIYIDRNYFHYICASIDPKRNNLLEELDEDAQIPGRTFGCGIQLIDKRQAERVGFFDTDYPMGWGDDGEFHHRMNLTGATCYAVPEALVYHEAIKGAPRIYGQVYNRLSIIIQTYSLRSLLVLSPALILYELSLALFLITKRKHKDYFKAIHDIFAARKRLAEKRHHVQGLRLRSDRELFTSGELYIPGVYRGSMAVRTALGTLNMLLNFYWWLARRLL